MASPVISKIDLPTGNLLMDKTEKDFQGTFNSIINKSLTLLSDEAKGMDESIEEWLKLVLAYNVPHGKQIRGRAVEMAYKKLQPAAFNENFEQARILGWCVEIASFLIADDIMDKGKTRRGRPCWYLVEGIGDSGINDAFLLEHCALQLIRLHFGKSEIYTDLVDLFLTVTFKTILGQSLDTKMGSRFQFEEYSQQLYTSIVIHKTSFYTIYLPVALAMILAGIRRTNENYELLWKPMEEISIKIGTLFQVQDDYFDCFGDQGITGKLGSDIQEGKCTWLFVQAKEICNPAQFQILKQNYGIWNTDNVEVVKSLYHKFQMPKIFDQLRDDLHSDIVRSIGQLEHEALRSIFATLLDNVYKRGH